MLHLEKCDIFSSFIRPRPKYKFVTLTLLPRERENRDVGVLCKNIVAFPFYIIHLFNTWKKWGIGGGGELIFQTTTIVVTASIVQFSQYFNLLVTFLFSILYVFPHFIFDPYVYMCFYHTIGHTSARQTNPNIARIWCICGD